MQLNSTVPCNCLMLSNVQPIGILSIVLQGHMAIVARTCLVEASIWQMYLVGVTRSEDMNTPFVTGILTRIAIKRIGKLLVRLVSSWELFLSQQLLNKRACYLGVTWEAEWNDIHLEWLHKVSLQYFQNSFCIIDFLVQK